MRFSPPVGAVMHPHASCMHEHQHPPRYLRTAEAAIYMFGTSTPATRARIARLVDRGDLGAIRIGIRGDRLIPVAEIEALAERAAAARTATASP